MLRIPFAVALVFSLWLTACREKPPVAGNAPEPEAPADPWRPLSGKWEHALGGEIKETDGVLQLGMGYSMTGARWTGEIPQVPFELEAEARRVEGTDFFFSVTFPGRTDDEAASLIVGGWGGGLVGISSIDGLDASENETADFREFENGRWYSIRLRVTADEIRAWIDDEEVIDVSIEGRRLSLRVGPIEDCQPFGVATWETIGEVRGMRWKPLAEPLQP
ncbi:DUF1080 domain-containing protein [Haloferula sp. A504]|uniref:DUF1080 domain-containing protein n=1 Tax=Haloferula sp. A504 TaxID=3373601 RepID=UPI0031C1FDF0|nr:DUF1080 domain-containing protein [Verrucomicrobiaceae bacterium E54]